MNESISCNELFGLMKLVTLSPVPTLFFRPDQQLNVKFAGVLRLGKQPHYKLRREITKQEQREKVITTGQPNASSLISDFVIRVAS